MLWAMLDLSNCFLIPLFDRQLDLLFVFFFLLHQVLNLIINHGIFWIICVIATWFLCIPLSGKLLWVCATLEVSQLTLLFLFFQVYIKFLDISNNWSGVLRFGFTSNDPSNLRYSLPKYACPDLTSKPGYWAKALAERFAERGTVLYYYVNQMGDVYFGINGEEKGIFLSGVETRDPLWALFDVYGNSTGIELIDRRIPLNNSRRSVQGSQDSSPDVDAQLSSPFQSMCIQNTNQRPEGSENQSDSNALSRYHQAETGLTPLPFHR